MVYDEMVLLQRMKHPNIVRFHDWFESKVKVLACSILEVEQADMERVDLGQILHRDSVGYWWRAF